ATHPCWSSTKKTVSTALLGGSPSDFHVRPPSSLRNTPTPMPRTCNWIRPVPSIDPPPNLAGPGKGTAGCQDSPPSVVWRSVLLSTQPSVGEVKITLWKSTRSCRSRSRVHVLPPSVVFRIVLDLPTT